MADARHTYRKCLAFIMGFSLFWFFTQAYNAGHAGRMPIVVAIALGVFFYLHNRVINSLGFFTEFSDLADRGPLQNILVFGDWFEKQKDLKIARDSHSIAMPPWLSLSAIFYWIVVGFVFTSLAGHFSVSFFATATLAIWAWSSPRALMWVPVQCVILFLTLWVAPGHAARIVSCISFLAFLVTYAASFTSYLETNRGLRFDNWLSAYWRPATVFLITFLLSTYFFPDEQTAARLFQIKSHWAEQIAHSRAPGRGSGAQRSNDNGGGGGGESGGHDGGSGGSGESGSQGQQGKQGSGGQSQAPSQNPPPQSQTAQQKQQQVSQASSQQSAQPRSSQQKLSQKIDPEKIQHIIDLIEKALKAALIILLLWWAFSYFTQKPEEKKSRARRRNRRKLKAVINEIDQIMEQKYENQHEEIVATYHAFLTAMGAIGLRRLDWQTPEQFSHESAKKIQYRDMPEILTRAFSASYYGENALSKDEMSRFRSEAKKIKNIIF